MFNIQLNLHEHLSLATIYPKHQTFCSQIPIIRTALTTTPYKKLQPIFGLTDIFSIVFNLL